MAPGCEPAAVRSMMKALQPLSLGQSLAGAGGGGFLFLLTREPQQREAVREILTNIQVRQRNWFSYYRMNTHEEEWLRLTLSKLTYKCISKK